MVSQLPSKRGRGGYLEALLTSCPVAIIATDSEGTITFANGEAGKLTERSLNEMVGDSIVTVYENLEAARETNRILFQNQGLIRDHETRARTKSGKIVPVRLSAAHLKDSTGNYVGAVGFFEEYRPWTAEEKRMAAYAREMEARLEEWKRLGIPITELYPGLSLLIIAGPVDLNRFETISADLMNHIRMVKSQVVLIDLSEATITDSSVASKLNTTIRTLHLLGTQCILGGVQLELAKSIERLESSVISLHSYSSLKAAIDSALEIIGLRLCQNK